MQCMAFVSVLRLRFPLALGALVAACHGEPVTQVSQPGPCESIDAFCAVAIYPDAATIHVGDTLTLRAQFVIPADSVFAWISSDTAKLKVNRSGQVRGLAPGYVGVCAHTGDYSGCATIDVTPISSAVFPGRIRGR